MRLLNLAAAVLSIILERKLAHRYDTKTDHLDRVLTSSALAGPLSV